MALLSLSPVIVDKVLLATLKNSRMTTRLTDALMDSAILAGAAFFGALAANPANPGASVVPGLVAAGVAFFASLRARRGL